MRKLILVALALLAAAPGAAVAQQQIQAQQVSVSGTPLPTVLATKTTTAQAAAAAPVQSVAGRTGAVTLTHSDITDWSSTLGVYQLTSGLGSAAFQASSAFDAAGAATSALTSAEAYSANASNLASGTVAAARLPVATTSVFGAVKPDGTSITISGGVISAVTAGLPYDASGAAAAAQAASLQKSSNLSDLASTSTARTNLGLGSAATQPSSAFAPATSGSAILQGNGSGGFSSVTIGSGLSLSAGVLSATGGGAGAPASIPAWQPNSFYTIQHSLNFGGGGIGGGAIVAIPIYIPSSVTLKTLSIHLYAATSGASAVMGIAADASGLPGALVAQIGTPISLASTGDITGTLTTNYAASPGLYWLEILASDNCETYIISNDPVLAPYFAAGITDLFDSGGGYFNSYFVIQSYSSGLPTNGSSLTWAGYSRAPLIAVGT